MDDSTHRTLPDLVVVPTSSDDGPDRRVELWQGPDGRLVLYCYSDVEALHRLYRPGCPWARLDLGEVAAVRAHVRTLLLDASPGATPTGPVPVVPGQRRA